MASSSERLLRQQLRGFSSSHLLPGKLKKKQRKPKKKIAKAPRQNVDATEANVRMLLNKGAEETAAARRKLASQLLRKVQK